VSILNPDLRFRRFRGDKIDMVMVYTDKDRIIVHIIDNQSVRTKEWDDGGG
jgi:hypothetical protein